ncbi:synergin gamma isoform X16 [Balaenoptera acutorostrata]|uniref:Synergin gamma isoform X16 n=1 Tax=Balaenoptera acutorostrata TaxID=9767 RepID=A0A384ASB6_BALAC|nr:synergin gamma isoform X16 [Balaenoptera acutorostrata]
MALRPGTGAGGGGAAGPGAGAAGGGSFMFPVAGGIRPPQAGLMPMQQQGFPMVSVMQPNMQGMIGMNYSSQMSQGPIAMQAGIPMGPIPAGGMPYLGQAPFLGMRPPGPQYTPDMQKQFAEEQQKRFEQQQKLLEEERKRRQFEEQKQKLRLLSSVKPKTGEKSRDDALEAIKGNLDGFSRDAKMHPTPASHPKKPDYPTSSHSAKTVSPSPAFLDEEEFSDFMQGPVEAPTCGPSSTSQPFQSFHPTAPLGQLHAQKAGAQYIPPGPSLEEKLLVSCDISTSGQEQIKLNTSEVGHKAIGPGSSKNHPSLTANNGGAVDGRVSGTTTAEAEKTSDQNLSIEESGVGVFPSQDPVQPRMPPWIYNESLVPDAYKKILETTMTPTGIDTAKLYPILMSSGLPRETLGQIWALANRTTPGKLTKEELYTVLAMIAVTQRGVPAMSPDALNQFPAAPVPTLSGFPMTLPTAVSQPTGMPSGPAGSMPLTLGQPVMGINLVGPVGGAAAQTSRGFLSTYPANQVVKPEEDDFQDFQDASKSGSLDDSFSDFQELPASSKSNSQHGNSAPSLLMPLPGTKGSASVDKYAVFKGIAADKSSENTVPFGEPGDKYSAFRELEQTAESKSLDIEDLKCAAFGTYSSSFAVSTLTSYDCSDRDGASQGRKLSPFVLSAGSGASAAASALQKKDTSFGSTENLPMTSLSKVTAFTSEDAPPETTFPAFASFKDVMPQASEQKEYKSGDYRDFTRQDLPAAERSQEATCPSPASSSASHDTPKECADDFGEFQSEKPKISKFDFLVANSQGKMKSSEEMIKSELATFDLSVQGSHKRSLSLGDKEISRSSPSPAPEQPFRDRSNTLSEKPALPVIRDKYKDLTGEVEENERYAYEWQRCLGSALEVIKKANDTLNGISSSSVCTEVIQSAQGMEYLLGVVEVYRVTKRVELGIKATAVCSEKLQQLLKDIDKVWNNLIGFMSLATLTQTPIRTQPPCFEVLRSILCHHAPFPLSRPDENSLDFSSCMLRPGIKNAQELACGVCLLNVDSRSRKEEKPAEEHPKKAFNSDTDSFKLAYGGHQYHASCANFWINCVEPKPPGLVLPDLL